MADLKDVSTHFGVSIQAMAKYIGRHLEEINFDGEHVKKCNGKWLFDEVAIKKIEALKGFGIAGVIEEVENEKIKELKILVDNLQTALLNAQNNEIVALKKLAENEKERRLIAEKTEKEKEELVELRVKYASLKKTYEEKMERAAGLAEAYNKMKNANIIDRILKNW